MGNTINFFLVIIRANTQKYPNESIPVINLLTITAAHSWLLRTPGTVPMRVRSKPPRE